MKEDIERRVLPLHDVGFRVESSDDGPSRLVGRAAVTNTLSQDLGGFREQIAPGAFAKALKRSDVRALFNHDPNLVLGRTKSGTLSLSEDEKGLRFEVDVPDTTTGRDVLTSVQRGDIDGNSFSFTVADGGEAWTNDTKPPTRTITEFRQIFDVGPVTFPAYKATKVSTRCAEFLDDCDPGDETPNHDHLERLQKQAEVEVGLT